MTPALGFPDEWWDTAAEGVADIARAVRDEAGLRTVFHHHCATFVETRSGRLRKVTFDAATRTITAHSPAGREVVQVLDARARIVETRRHGLVQRVTWEGGRAAAIGDGPMRRTFAYVFEETQSGGGKPQLDLIGIREPFRLLGLEVVPVPVWHGDLEVFGYRMGSFAYVTDCNRIPEESFELLRG